MVVVMDKMFVSPENSYTQHFLVFLSKKKKKKVLTPTSYKGEKLLVIIHSSPFLNPYILSLNKYFSNIVTSFSSPRLQLWLKPLSSIIDSPIMAPLFLFHMPSGSPPSTSVDSSATYKSCPSLFKIS